VLRICVLWFCELWYEAPVDNEFVQNVLFQYGSGESPSHEVVMRSPQPRAAVQREVVRCGSEPIYVNMPLTSLKGSTNDEGGRFETEWRVPNDNNTYDTISAFSGDVLINENADVFDDTGSVLSDRETQCK